MALWALVIAIEEYPAIQGMAKRLDGTHNAGRRFREWLIKNKRVPAANIVACAGAQCRWRTAGTTSDAVTKALEDLVIPLSR